MVLSLDRCCQSRHANLHFRIQLRCLIAKQLSFIVTSSMSPPSLLLHARLSGLRELSTVPEKTYSGADLCPYFHLIVWAVEGILELEF